MLTRRTSTRTTPPRARPADLDGRRRRGVRRLVLVGVALLAALATSCSAIPPTPVPGGPAPTPTAPTATAPAVPGPTPGLAPPGTNAWNPPAHLVRPLEEVWAHYEQTYPRLHTFRNYGWDQLFANGGYLNYCVRWDSDAPVTAALRDRIHAKLEEQVNLWVKAMLDNGAGFMNWPYSHVPVKVVGWAVRDRALLQWNDNSVDIYVGDINTRERAPQCPQPCNRYYNHNGDYSKCPGGAAKHFDMSLWLTKGMTGGQGTDWGQRVGSEYMVNNLNTPSVHILLHEIGHSFGLDDFYDWTPTGVQGFLMKAGSAMEITEFDKWMFRDFWRHLKHRYGR